MAPNIVRLSGVMRGDKIIWSTSAHYKSGHRVNLFVDNASFTATAASGLHSDKFPLDALKISLVTRSQLDTTEQMLREATGLPNLDLAGLIERHSALAAWPLITAQDHKHAYFALLTEDPDAESHVALVQSRIAAYVPPASTPQPSPSNPQSELKPAFMGLAKYLGGHPGLGKQREGHLCVTNEGIGISGWSVTGGLKYAVIKWTEVRSVDVSGGEVAKSKFGAEIMFGVLGGLGAKGAMGQTIIAVYTIDSNIGYYQINEKHPAEVKARLTPFLRAVGIPYHDERVQQDNADALKAALGANGPVGVSDELSKLAALRDQGVLTEEEFTAQKAKLLSAS